MQKIKIPQPKAIPGDPVNVLNYRRKPKGFDGVWEEGIILDIDYSLSSTASGKPCEKGYWSYRVLLGRRTPSKTNYCSQRETGLNRIYISALDKGIKKICHQ